MPAAAELYNISVKKQPVLSAFLVCLLCCAARAGALPLESLRVADLPAAGPRAVSAPGRAVPVKEWTVLIYVSARNNLGLEAIKDVNEMEAAGSTDRVNVAVEMGRIKCPPPFNPFASVQEPPPPQADWTGSRRFLIKKDSDAALITSPVLEQYPDADMGDWRHLAEFIAWGKANFPAKKYMLIVGGHGSGWRGVKPPAAAPKGISYDEVSNNHISPAELAQAIRAGGGVNVYASDACLMQTIEVLYDLRDSAEFIVGSQETTPGSGYNYEVFLKALAAAPGDAFAAAQHVMTGYSGYYGGLKESVTMSIVRPARAAEMAGLLDKFARLVAASPADLQLYRDKRYGLRSFDDEDARDLYQLMKLYYDNSPTPAVREAARSVIAFLSEKLVARNDAVGYKSKDANGVSVYFPVFYMNYVQKYEYLSFSGATYWDEMVKAAVEAK